MLMVVTGGVRSGKSAVAARLAQTHGGYVTVAVFGNGDDDPEMAERIALHQKDRPDTWRVLAPPDSLTGLEAEDEGLLLVDCLGTFVASVMESEWGAELGPYGEAVHLPYAYREAVEARVDWSVRALVGRASDTIVVTNEVGDGVVPEYALGRFFRDVMGRTNRRLITAADAAWLVVAGRCVELTALPRDVSWPRG